MNVLADISLVAVGVGTSLSEHVAACERILREAGLNPRLHAFGTNVEGDWDAVMEALRRCHDVVHAMGAPRIHTTIRLGTRMDRTETLQDKLDSVLQKL